MRSAAAVSLLARAGFPRSSGGEGSRAGETYDLLKLPTGTLGRGHCAHQNDRVDLSLALGIGVHLPRAMPTRIARASYPERRSAARRTSSSRPSGRATKGADYTPGPIFDTLRSAPTGLLRPRRAAPSAPRRRLSILAIGGITVAGSPRSAPAPTGSPIGACGCRSAAACQPSCGMRMVPGSPMTCPSPHLLASTRPSGRLVRGRLPKGRLGRIVMKRVTTRRGFIICALTAGGSPWPRPLWSLGPELTTPRNGRPESIPEASMSSGSTGLPERQPYLLGQIFQFVDRSRERLHFAGDICV
jgi:hypothetical protein